MGRLRSVLASGSLGLSAERPQRSRHVRRPAGASRRSEAPGVASRREAADLIEAVYEGREPLTAVTERLEPGAGFVRALVRTAVRRRGDIAWCLSRLMTRPLPRKASGVRAVLSMASGQILFMRQADHAAVATAVDVLKGQPETAGFAALANAVLRRLIKERATLLDELPAAANTPRWLWQRWENAYGPDTAAAFAATHREEPPLDLALADPSAPPAIPDALTLPTGGLRVPTDTVSHMTGFVEGAFWVQDMAAQLPVTALGNVQGRRIADLCAAPGGKTMQLAAAGAQVVAVEASAKRAERLVENLARTGLSPRVEVRIADARSVAGTFDAVLLDAPCSSTGTLRRHPDVAWAKRPGDIDSLVTLQRELLAHAATLLGPGGRLVYATCSLEPEEGEHQADWATNALGLNATPVQGAAATFADGNGRLRTLPHQVVAPGIVGLDGFFAATFVRA